MGILTGLVWIRRGSHGFENDDESSGSVTDREISWLLEEFQASAWELRSVYLNLTYLLECKTILFTVFSFQEYTHRAILTLCKIDRYFLK